MARRLRVQIEQLQELHAAAIQTDGRYYSSGRHSARQQQIDDLKLALADTEAVIAAEERR